jgi:16S rRNA (guanine966-N2)-methyltransferase
MPDSLRALKANITALHVRDRTRVFKHDAILFAAALDGDAYDIAFADPPYESRKLDRVLESWQERRFAEVFAVEHARSHPVPGGSRRLVFEDTAVTIFRARRKRRRR